MTTVQPSRHGKAALFVAEYLIDLNATKAAERAGYSRRTARFQGSRLLRNVNIQRAIQEKMDRRAEKIGITAERVLQELALLGFANMLDYIVVGDNGSAKVDLSKLTRDQAAAIGEIVVEEFTERTGEDADGRPIFENVRRTKFKLTDKRAALVDLGRHLKLFTVRVEVEDPAQREIQDVKQKLLAKLGLPSNYSMEPGLKRGSKNLVSRPHSRTSPDPQPLANLTPRNTSAQGRHLAARPGSPGLG